VTWLLTAVGTVLVMAGMFLAIGLGELLARRDVPLPGEEPMWLERVIDRVQRLRRRR
jgi:hypothetical protein